MRVTAVSQRVDFYPQRGETRDCLDHRLVEFLYAAECLTIPVPNMFESSTLKLFLDIISPDVIVLSGGNDIGECPERDFTEGYLLDYAESLCLPVLGICRGMQMMACRSGATLQSIPGHVATRHRVKGEMLRDVNSFHDKSLTSCPSDFRVLAISDDKNIEAIQHKKNPWEGWMWHPEREDDFVHLDILRLQSLICRLGD